MSYSVKELFYSLQGEGVQAGRPAVFLRFAGCNLWTGREADRDGADCAFCDTDFVGTDGEHGGRFEDAGRLADTVAALWPRGSARRLVVVTGGEPALQLDDGLLGALHAAGFEVAVETNGTRPLPPGCDWVTVSPKAGADLAVAAGDELKLVYPQPGAEPERFAGLAFDHFLLQPLDGPERDANTRAAVAYCRDNPHWRLSLQTHKWLGIR